MKLNGFQERIIQEAMSSKGHGGKAAKSAMRHLSRAWELRFSMPELASFSAVCAEEESAAAVFYALKKRKYPRANELNPRNHLHKHGLHPFLNVLMNEFLPVYKELNLELFFDSDLPPKGKNTLRTRLVLEIVGNEKRCVVPDYPVHIISVSKEGGPRKFTEQFRKIASENGVKSMFDYIKKLANQRNEYLYASPQGIPNIEDATETVVTKAQVMLGHFIAFLLIEPYKIQHLPKESLNTFLDMLNRVEITDEL